jgi:PadR family transcriptional regulator AphA
MAEQSTDYALLGLLSIEPMSGYDIRQNFRESLNFFWNESYGQIYPALKRLLAQGYIAPVAGRRNGRRERRAYTVTSTGRAHLRIWLAKPPRKQPIRDELLLKVFLGRLAAPGACAEHIRRLRREQEELLARYQEIKKRVGIERAGHPHTRFWYMTLKHGIEMRRARIRWCDETLAALEELPKPSRRPQKK